MTIKTLKEWQFSQSVEDKWWHCIDGNPPTTTTTLEQIALAVNEKPQSNHQVIHCSQANHDNPPWVNVESDAKKGLPRKLLFTVILIAATIVLLVALSFLLLLTKTVTPNKAVAVAPNISTPLPTPTPIPAYVKTFIHNARRMDNAISTGISYSAFHDQLPELVSSAQEAINSTNDAVIKQNIALYIQSLLDADNLWGVKLLADEDEIKLRKGSDGLSVDLNVNTQKLNNRWLYEVSKLEKQYDFAGGEAWGTPNPIQERGYQIVLIVEPALKRVFGYSSYKFSEIDKRVNK